MRNHAGTTRHGRRATGLCPALHTSAGALLCVPAHDRRFSQRKPHLGIASRGGVLRFVTRIPNGRRHENHRPLWGSPAAFRFIGVATRPDKEIPHDAAAMAGRDDRNIRFHAGDFAMDAKRAAPPAQTTLIHDLQSPEAGGPETTVRFSPLARVAGVRTPAGRRRAGFSPHAPENVVPARLGFYPRTQ